MSRYELISFSSPDELARQVAQDWLTEVAVAQRANKLHHVALSGGRITLKFFAAVIEIVRTQSFPMKQPTPDPSQEGSIAEGVRKAVPLLGGARGVFRGTTPDALFSQNLALDHVHFFWADERCLPPDDKESSYGVAREAFFRPLKLPAANIHRIAGETTPERAAELANAEIRRVVPANTSGQPALDLIFLGLGEDGHVASLFPGEPEAARQNPAVYRAIAYSPKPPPNRVTLGYAAIAAAKQVWVLASGAGKETSLQDSLSPGRKTPLGRVIESRVGTKVFTDIQILQ